MTTDDADALAHAAGRVLSDDFAVYMETLVVPVMRELIEGGAPRDGVAALVADMWRGAADGLEREAATPSKSRGGD